eukprot:m.363431 g.363431  ORF g.363431 m.363431 type:complete len:324 (+) comp22503_c0_seq1:91-1062(+)
MCACKQGIVMVRPHGFGLNAQTATDNHFQPQQKELADIASASELALKEFDTFQAALVKLGVRVHVLDDDPTLDIPDSVFPNNWFTTHEDGTVVLYPMKAVNRRLERMPDLQQRLQGLGYRVSRVLDLSPHEQEGRILEGTGSMVFDYTHGIAYAAISQRTDKALFEECCAALKMTPVSFHAYQTVEGTRVPIYHTNVMLSVGEQFAVVCLASIDDGAEREQLLSSLKDSGKQVIEISEEQVALFCGNVLQLVATQSEVEPAKRQHVLAMSTTAFKGFTEDQKETLMKWNTLLHTELHTIETLGGGSARCMLAEVMLPIANPPS